MGFFKINHRGESLIELLVVAGIVAVLLPALLTAFVLGRDSRPQTLQRAQATALMNEGFEAVRALRDQNWSLIATDGVFYPRVVNTNWSLVSGTESVNGFSRSITIEPVFRDDTGAITQSGGTVDPSAKYVTVQVGWTTPKVSQVTETAIFTRYRDNLAYTQTTQTEFNTGTLTGVATTNTSGGEVILGSGGGGDWCGPTLVINPVDLPKNGVANGLTAIEGKLFAGTGDNASGVSYATVTVTNENPPTGSVSQTFDGYKTNDIFGEANYVYIATDTNSKEVVILNLQSSPVSEVGFFDASGPTDANAVYTSGSVGYMTQGSNFRTFDLSSKSGSRSQLGSVTLAGTGTEIVVLGTYAYVSISGSSTKLQIVDVSNPASPSVVGFANPSGSNGQDVFVNDTGTRAYLVTSANASGAEFYIVDTSTKSGSRSILGTYDTSGMSPVSVTVVTGNKAIVVGSGGQEYQVVSIANEASPTSCGGLNIDTGVQGVASVLETDGDAYSYIITGDSSAELKIIEGGPGGRYATSGTYTSAAFDAGWTTAFNRINFGATVPNQTSIQVQVAVADAVSGSCTNANYQYVGPDGTSSTFFTQSGALALSDDSSGYENPGRCFKYKVYFSTSDSTATPVFQDVTVNYSP